MRIKVDHEKANIASGTHYSEGHQKFENSGQKMLKITPKGSSGMDSLKLEKCEVCYVGMMDPNTVETKEKIENEGVKFKIEEKIKSQEEKFDMKRKSVSEEIEFKINGDKFELEEKIVERKIEKEKVENVVEKMDKRKHEKIVAREKKKLKRKIRSGKIIKELEGKNL